MLYRSLKVITSTLNWVQYSVAFSALTGCASMEMHPNSSMEMHANQLIQCAGVVFHPSDCGEPFRILQCRGAMPSLSAIYLVNATFIYLSCLLFVSIPVYSEVDLGGGGGDGGGGLKQQGYLF